MNEILGMMTVFSMMLGGGQKVTGPIPCEKQVSSRVDSLLLEDEGGKVGENVALEKTETAENNYIFDYKVRTQDGSEHEHAYHVSVNKACSDIEVKKL